MRVLGLAQGFIDKTAYPEQPVFKHAQSSVVAVRNTLENHAVYCGDFEIINERLGVTAPLPTLGFAGNWAFTDNRKWILGYRLGYFALGLDLDKDADEKVEGDLLDGQLNVYYKAFS